MDERVEVGSRWADTQRPGRVVEVIESEPAGLVVETVEAAESASSERAVGKRTAVSWSTFRHNFRRAPN